MRNRFNDNIVYLEHYGNCTECGKMTNRYDTSIASFLCSEKCSKSWNDKFHKWCLDEEKKQQDGIIGLRVSFDVLIGTVSCEEAQMTLETIQESVTQLLLDKGLCPTGGTGEFLKDGDTYTRKIFRGVANE